MIILKIALALASVKIALASNLKLDYPVARKDESIVEDFHGVKVADVYRWLEDPDATETRAFVEAQNKLTRSFLESGDKWGKFNAKLSKLWNFPTYTLPDKHGGKYYFWKNTGLQNQYVLYQQDSLDSEPKVFFDPNELSENGTIALAERSFSDNGRYFAYGLSESGSDWKKIKIRDVATGKDFDETLEKIKFTTIDWTKDNKGFFYSAYPDQNGKIDGSETNKNEFQKLLYHRVGEPQANDVVVVEFPDEPTWGIWSQVSDCGKYIVLFVYDDSGYTMVWYANLNQSRVLPSKLVTHPIVDKFEANYDFIANNGPEFYFLTNKDAPNYKVVTIDIRNPTEGNWKTLIEEHATDVLDWVYCVHGDKLVLGYIHDVKSLVQVHSLETGEFLRKFDVDVGTVHLAGKREVSEVFYSVSSFMNPGTFYRYDFAIPDVEPKIIRQVSLDSGDFKPDKFKVEQVFYAGKDGTKIPMFIVRKNTSSVTPRPCLLYGYGGFGTSLMPGFSLFRLMFIDTFDGFLAIANLRGGGEYGEKWHDAGRLLNKQNVFDDFQAAAQYLINNNYTAKEKLVIKGVSNGGLLVGACINQRPDLFGAAIAQVGVMDMLRYHKFTLGHGWISDYGDPSEKEHFENLYKYSPLHNVHTPKSASEEYPSTLITTADHDDRVSPLHSLKFAAALQEAARNSKFQKNPLLLRVYSNGGHGAGKPTKKVIEELTDMLVFIYKSLDVDVVNF